MIQLKMLSFRRYGDKKLSKPKELKGTARAFSVDYIPKKARCQVFILGADVYVKHVDYFSPTRHVSGMSGAPLNVLLDEVMGRNRPAKFTYEDAWGSLVLRQEAWLKITGLYVAAKSAFMPKLAHQILEQQAALHDIDVAEIMCSYMSRFWEEVINTLKREK